MTVPTASPQKKEAVFSDTLRYARTILNSLSAHIAIIDRDGTILETNPAWKAFADSNRIRMRPDTLGVNYLAICDAARGESADHSAEVADGIRRVINGDITEFIIDYPCHAPDAQRWFYMRATRAVGPGPVRVVISHEDITHLKTIENRLRQREEELQETNAALRALLRQRETDRKEQEESVFRNVRETVLPGLDQLKQTRDAEDRQRLLQQIEARLEKIASPFLLRLSSLQRLLTPQETRIALMIKEGHTTKDIAGMLNLSETTVNFHRRNLREKLGLKNAATNLRTFLLSVAE